MSTASVSAARLPDLAAKLTRCVDKLLDCLDRDDLANFDRRLDERRRLLAVLRAALLAVPAPEPGWRALFAEAMDGEARFKARVEAEYCRLTGELKQVGEARTNLERLAEVYIELDK